MDTYRFGYVRPLHFENCKKEGFFLHIQKSCWSYYLLQTANLKKVNLSTKLWKTLANLGLTFPLQCVLVSRKQTKYYLFPFQSAYILLWFECICILHTVWGQDKYLSALFLTHTDLRNTEQVCTSSTFAFSRENLNSTLVSNPHLIHLK